MANCKMIKMLQVGVIVADAEAAAKKLCEMFQIDENHLRIILPPQMMAMPGLVLADLVLVTPAKTLATFNFEFYVNPAVVTGSSPEAGSFYKLSSLDQINAAIAALQAWQADTDRLIAHIEQEVFELKRIVNEM